MDAAQPPRILIVEDEEKTAATIAMYLRHEGMVPVVVRDGSEGLRLIGEEPFDLVILDLMLPGVCGQDICRKLRESSDTPVIMVTALGTEQQRIDGLDLGADDYVSKPFSPRELMARVRARLRTRNGTGQEAIRCMDLVIYPDRREITVGSEPVSLTSAEFDLLSCMAGQPGRVWTREQLMDKVLGDASERYDRTIDAHIKNLRRKIEPDRRNPRYIQTVFGVGYRFNGGS